MPNSTNNGQHLALDENQNYVHEYTTHETYQDVAARNTDAEFEQYYEKPTVPQKKPFYKNKKYWIICSIITVIVVVVVILLVLFVAFPKIAQHTMNQSRIEVNAAQITFEPPSGSSLQPVAGADPNSTFYMHMVTDLKNTGPFSANIQFNDDVQVLFNNTVLGTITLPDTHISGGHGSIDTVTLFKIADVTAFSSFSKYMLANEKFTWTLDGKARITALSRTAEVSMKKDITLEGMNGFPQVRINSFQLPGDAPTGGILLELGTVLTSPSPIGVQLGHIEMDVSYDGVDLGIVKADNVILRKGDNDIVLKGTLKSQANDPVAQEKVGKLFSNYIAGLVSNTTATGVSAAPNGKDPITWLSEGLRSVVLHVALGADKPLKIMNSVNMGYLDLAFQSNAPYSPSLRAPVVTAGYSMPFGFALNITEVTQNITLGLNKSGTFEPFAVLNVPYVPSTSDQISGKLQFAIPQGSIAGIPGKESAFNEYTFGLTSSGNYTFVVAGNATTKVNTTIGPLVLSGINFELPTSIHGLEFLNSSATVINSLDVTGGQSDYLELAINVTMNNPSDFSIATGDAAFDMIADSTQLGKVILRNLTLNRGANTVLAAAQFDPKSSQTGQSLLSNFVMGQDNTVEIQGNANSTSIVSLAEGLSAISLSSQLPGLKVALIQGSSLVVPPNAAKDGMVNVKVSIANPFSAGMTITKVTSAVTYNGMPVGNIDQDISNNPIVIPGKSTVQSGDLSMQMNVEPGAVALLLRTLAVNANLNTRPLDALLTVGGFSIDGQEQVSADPELFNGFNISSFVMDAMKILKVDLTLASALKIGQYDNTLTFSQSAVQTSTDSTVTSLIPIVGQKIVQQIVDASVLAFDSIIMSEPTESSFKVQMKGSITKTGPMAASISFPTPLTVSWQGKVLGHVSMPIIEAKPGSGATFDVNGEFSIADSGSMTAFATYMINNGNFEWEITSDDVSVNALGFAFGTIKMHKFVTLSGANGFKDAVKINKFELPRNNANNNGIVITVDSAISNPSQVGFNFANVAFDSYYKDVRLGPLNSVGAAVFPPKGSSGMNMEGELVKQDSEKGLAAVTEVFMNYLSEKDSILTVKGVSASGPNGLVSWLSTAFKTLEIQNVVLPRPTTKPNLITSVNMNDLQMDFTKNPFAAPAGSKDVVAKINSPFAFPLGISSMNMKVDATSEGQKVANLDVPTVPATSTPDNVVHAGFSDVPFKVYSGAEATFTKFVGGLTLLPKVGFGLAGVVNSVANTAVGPIHLNNIPFNVETSLNGFAGFGGTSEILSLKVVGGYPTYIAVELVIALNNPSNITITTNDLTFDVVMDATGSSIGSVTLPKPTILPGRNEMKANMKMTGTDLLSLSRALTNYLTGQTTALTVKGTEKSTDIIPLQPGLSKVQLKTNMVGIPPSLVVESQMQLAGLTSVNIWVKFYNPLDTVYTVAAVDTLAYFTDKAGKYQLLGTIQGAFSPAVTVPPKGTAISENPVTMKLASLGVGLSFIMLPEDQKKVDLIQNVTVVVGEGFKGGMHYEQKSVPVVNRPASAEIQAMVNSMLSSAAPSSGISSATSAVSPTTTAATSAATTTAAPETTVEPSSTTTTAASPNATTTKVEPTTSSNTTPQATTPAATMEAASNDNKPSTTSSTPSSGTSNSGSPPVAKEFVWPF